jgi:hypothetical protein
VLHVLVKYWGEALAARHKFARGTKQRSKSVQ